MLDGKSYALLVVERTDGKYTYPSIYEDWYTFKEWSWVVTEWSTLSALLSPDAPDNQAYEAKLHPVYCGTVTEYDGSLTKGGLADSVVEHLPYTDLCSTHYEARIFPVNLDGERSVRFFLDWGYTNAHRGSILSGAPSEPDIENFDHYYYEVPLSTFRKLIDARP